MRSRVGYGGCKVEIRYRYRTLTVLGLDVLAPPVPDHSNFIRPPTR
jgi:hypothetical protein